MIMATVDTLLEEAKRLESERNFKEAEQRYSEFICFCVAEIDRGRKNAAELNDQLALAYNNRGLIRYLMVDFENSIRDFTTALELDSEMAVSYYNRGLVYYRLGQFERALQDLGESHRLDPDFQSTNDALHQTLLDKNAWRSASSTSSPVSDSISPPATS